MWSFVRGIRQRNQRIDIIAITAVKRSYVQGRGLGRHLLRKDEVYSLSTYAAAPSRYSIIYTLFRLDCLPY